MNKLKLSAVLSVILLATIVCAVQPALAARVQLPEGTEIQVKFPAGVTISSGTMNAGIPVLFYLDQAITIGGKVIVEKGAEGTAVVKECTPAGKGGKPGKLVLEFSNLATKGSFKTDDDSLLKLAGKIEAAGKGKKLLSYLFIAGLFIKGGQAVIPTQQTYTAKIAETVILSDS